MYIYIHLSLTAVSYHTSDRLLKNDCITHRSHTHIRTQGGSHGINIKMAAAGYYQVDGGAVYQVGSAAARALMASNNILIDRFPANLVPLNNHFRANFANTWNVVAGQRVAMFVRHSDSAEKGGVLLNVIKYACSVVGASLTVYNLNHHHLGRTNARHWWARLREYVEASYKQPFDAVIVPAIVSFTQNASEFEWFVRSLIQSNVVGRGVTQVYGAREDGFGFYDLSGMSPYGWSQVPNKIEGALYTRALLAQARPINPDLPERTNAEIIEMAKQKRLDQTAMTPQVLASWVPLLRDHTHVSLDTAFSMLKELTDYEGVDLFGDKRRFTKWIKSQCHVIQVNHRVFFVNVNDMMIAMSSRDIDDIPAADKSVWRALLNM